MSKEHQLTVGKKAMQQMYEHFEHHLYSTYSCILGKLFSRGVLRQKQMYRIEHTSDPDQAFHMLLDHLCEQDSENLLILVKVLYDSGAEECLPGHTLLAEKLDEQLHLNEFKVEYDAVGTAQPPLCTSNQTLFDSVSNKSEPNPSSLPASVQATTEHPNVIPDVAESIEAWEYPDLISSLLYFFDGNVKEDDTCTLPSTSLSQQHKSTDLTRNDSSNQKQSVCAFPSSGMPLVRFSGSLKGRTHGDMVIKLWSLGGFNPTKCNLAYQLIRGKKQLPIDLQIINVLGAVYCTPDDVPLLKEALEWTKRPDCMNPVYLQCRLNYLLSICTVSSDKDLSEQYLKQAHELSAMCEPDYITALLVMQEARMSLSRIEEDKGQLEEETLMDIICFSNRACEISRSLPEWMQPFAIVIKLLKMQLDARVAFLLSKSKNRIGAIAAVSPLTDLLREVEEPRTFRQLLPRQQAVYHYIRTVVSVIHNDKQAARRSAVKGRDLYLKVKWVEPAQKIMEIVDE